jgi:hypothetical protein
MFACVHIVQQTSGAIVIGSSRIGEMFTLDTTRIQSYIQKKQTTATQQAHTLHNKTALSMRKSTDAAQINKLNKNTGSDSSSDDNVSATDDNAQDRSAPKYDKAATTQTTLRSKQHVLFSRTLINYKKHTLSAIPKKYTQAVAVPVYDAALYTKEGSVFGMSLVSLLHGLTTTTAAVNTITSTQRTESSAEAVTAVAARLCVFSVFTALQQQFAEWQTSRGKTAVTAAATATATAAKANEAQDKTVFDATTAAAAKSSNRVSLKASATKGFFSAGGDTPIEPNHTQLPVLAVPALRSLLQGSLGCCPSPPPAPHAPQCSEYNRVKASVLLQWDDQFYPGSAPDKYKVEAKGMSIVHIHLHGISAVSIT